MVQGMNQVTNGAREHRTCIEALAPAVFVPSHHDNWLPELTASARTDTPLHREFARLPAQSRSLDGSESNHQVDPSIRC